MRLWTGMAAALIVGAVLTLGGSWAVAQGARPATPGKKVRQEVSAAWWGFDPVDATKALQAAIDSGADVVRIPNTGKPWIVGPIALAGDQTLEFEEGVVIQAKAGLFKGVGDSLFTAQNKNNITLRGYGAKLVMQREDYIDPTRYKQSEWRHGIALRSCTNVSILGLTIENTGGDAIHISRVHPLQSPPGSTIRPYCRNVVVRDVNLGRNHRQGISIVSAENVLIENAVIHHTDGVAPGAGIALEPNYADERVAEIRVRNVELSDNRLGMMMQLTSLNAESSEVSVLFENCRVLSGPVAIDVVGPSDRGPAGTIRFKDCVVEAGVTRVRDKSVDAASLTFENCTFQNPAGAPIAMYASGGGTDRLGGVAFEACRVVETEGSPLFQVLRHRDATRLINVQGSLTVTAPQQARLTDIQIPTENVTLRINDKAIAGATR